MILVYGLTMDARTIAENKGRLYVSGNTGLIILDSITKATLFSFNDFFIADELTISSNGDLVLASNFLYGARIYDVNKMTIIGDIRCPSGYHIYPCSFSFSLNDESIYFCFNVFDQKISIFDEIDRMPGVYGLRRYYLKDLNHFDVIEFSEIKEITRLIPLRKRNKYLAVFEKGNLYYFYKDGLEKLPLDILDSCYRQVVYDENEDLLYFEEDHGIRVFNAAFKEVNRIDFAFLSKRDSDIYIQHYDKIINGFSTLCVGNAGDRNEIRDFLLFKDKYLVIYSGDSVSGISLLSVLDRKTGELLADQQIVGPVQSIIALEQGIAFSLDRHIYILEVVT